MWSVFGGKRISDAPAEYSHMVKKQKLIAEESRGQCTCVC